MKIAQVCHGYYPYLGGIETHVREISERLVKKRFEVEVLATDPSNKLLREERLNDVVIKRFKSWAPNQAYYFSKELKRYLVEKSNDYDVVHAHGYHAFPALYAAQSKKMNRLIFTPHYHGTGHTLFRKLLHIPYKFLGEKIFEKADRIVFVSNYERDLAMKRFKVDEKKVTVIPNGISVEEFRGLKKRSKDYRAILYVGRLEKYKGIQYLIQALPRVGHDVIFEIVGKGPYKEGLVELSRKAGVENKVRFFQDLPRQELLQMYADSDLFVLLSKYEAYGISVAEALASGTPCIVANASALKHWIDNEKCLGIDYPIDTNKLACLISDVIGRRIERVNLPDWEEVVEELVKLYEEDQGYEYKRSIFLG